MLNYIRAVVFSLKNTNTLARPSVYIDNRPMIWVKAGNLRPSAKGTPAATITMTGIRSELSLLHYRCANLESVLTSTSLFHTSTGSEAIRDVEQTNLRRITHPANWGQIE